MGVIRVRRCFFGGLDDELVEYFFERRMFFLVYEMSFDGAWDRGGMVYIFCIFLIGIVKYV